MNNEQAYRSKMLTDTQRTILLDRLDRDDAADPRNRERRKRARLAFRRVDVPLEITHPGGSSTSCRVATRNLSETGVSFLYWGFLHIGTDCRVEMRQHSGERELLDGKVAWCKHVIGPHHVIGIKFERNIVPKMFFEPAEFAKAEAAAACVCPATSPAAEAKLTGKILLIEEQDLDHQLLVHFLRNTKIQTTRVVNAASAVVEMSKSTFDALLFNVRADGPPGEQVLATCRSAGFKGPAIVMTAETSATRLAPVQRAGVSAILHKPYTRETLLSLLYNWLADEELEAAGPIYSTMAEQPEMSVFVEKFVSQTREIADALSKAINADDLSRVRGCCQTLLGTAASIGFGEVSAAAADAIQVIDAHGTIAQAAVELKRLESVCRRATVGVPPGVKASEPAKPEKPGTEKQKPAKPEPQSKPAPAKAPRAKAA